VLTLYAPSSTTYVKHFVSRANSASYVDSSYGTFVAGYINVTAAIDEISFKFHTGNIDAGVIKMYGIAKA
jgi:dUTPase